MTPSQSFIASAEIAERAGRTKLAEFWRDMAAESLSLEAAGGPFANLYAHWAGDAAEYATKLTEQRKVA